MTLIYDSVRGTTTSLNLALLVRAGGLACTDNGSAEIGVLISDDFRLVADPVVDIL